MKFKKYKLTAPDHDFDLTIVFPSGKKMLVQARPSNADVDSNGSLDIILPDNQPVTNWMGDNMKPAPAMIPEQPETHFAKQLVTELP